MTTVLMLAAVLNIDPVTTRWTFGAHEPYTIAVVWDVCRRDCRVEMKFGEGPNIILM